MSIFFTADTHLGHHRIIQYCNRPFQSSADAITNVEKMNDTILQRFNEVLKPGDILYHLGDVAWSNYSWSRFFDNLNCKQVHLVWGNHDKHMRGKELPKSIVHNCDLKSITIDKTNVLLCHYAMRTWPKKGKGGIQLYGHSHGMLPGEGRQIDVGVDTNRFYPYAWEEIRDRMLKIPYEEY